jgi:hypothetical protein
MPTFAVSSAQLNQANGRIYLLIQATNGPDILTTYNTARACLTLVDSEEKAVYPSCYSFSPTLNYHGCSGRAEHHSARS